MPKLEYVTPILCVADVTASIAYYRERLGFETTFTWGEPATFGGVRRDGVEVMFCHEGQGHPGTWMSDPDGHRLRFSMASDLAPDGVDLRVD
jgi:hypothetical protein